MSARTGWLSNVVRESLVNDNGWSSGFHRKSEHGNVIATTGGHGGPPLRGISFTLRLVVEQTLILLRNLQLVAEPANVIRDSLVNDNDWSDGFDWTSEHGNVIVTTGGHGGPPLRGHSFSLRRNGKPIWILSRCPLLRIIDVVP